MTHVIDLVESKRAVLYYCSCGSIVGCKQSGKTRFCPPDFPDSICPDAEKCAAHADMIGQCGLDSGKCACCSGNFSPAI